MRRHRTRDVRAGDDSIQPEAESPLGAIREAEDAVAAMVERAHETAERRTTESRREADRIRAKTRDSAERDADAAADGALRAARAEAKRIEAQARSLADAIVDGAHRELDPAAEAVVAFVVPRAPGDPSADRAEEERVPC